MSGKDFAIKKIAVVGQGYVGLPLAVAFSDHFTVVGFDVNEQRVGQLSQGNDHTQEISEQRLYKALENGYRATSLVQDMADAQCYIITVPTPIDNFNTPDLSYLLAASTTVASVLKKGDIVIYESTVYPGCTEEDCVPVLEEYSGLHYNVDFFVGYSPERINPGDKINTLETIVKVTSGSTVAVADEIDTLYNTVVKAGTYKASSIKVAEASKAIENAQRDINISFVNELALIFDRMNIDTQEVLEAAGTKFNFLKFKPGLVGGHCISVDPYYLAYKSSQLGYQPEVILSGRKVNNRMASFIASKVVKLFVKKNIPIKSARVLILGFAFKENCSDTRNTKVKDIVQELLEYGALPEVYDPWVDPVKVHQEFGIAILSDIGKDYDAVILTVAHRQFLELDLSCIAREQRVIFDCKGILPRGLVDARL